MRRFGQGDQLTQRQVLLLDGFFDSEGSVARDAFGAGGVLLGAMSLFDSGIVPFGGPINPDKISVGMLSSGAGLSLARNENLQNVGRWLLLGGIAYEGVVRTGLLNRFLS